MYWDTSKNVWQSKNLGFYFTVELWSFIDNVVYCNTLRSIKAAFLKVEKAKFAGATLVPMFTIITPGPYTHSKQSEAFHAKCNLKINCEKKVFVNQNGLHER